MTIPERRYWEKRYASTASALRRHQEVAGLELGREDDLRLAEGHLGLRVLEEQHGRRPLLPVRTLAVREADRHVRGVERDDQLLARERCLRAAPAAGHAARHGADLRAAALPPRRGPRR